MIYMSSTSANDGSSNITVSFDVGYPIDIAAVDVQNRVSAATAQLPAIVNQGGVTVQKKNPNLTLAVNLYSPDGSVDLVTLSNYAYLQLVDPLKRITGVGDVQIFGERRYSMRVWLDPDKLAKLGVTAVDVQNAIAEQNIQVAAGKIGGSPAPAGTMFTAQVNAMGRLSDPQQFDDIVIRAGTLVEARLLVIGVVFLFLQSRRTTVIPAIAIPVSLIATLAVMMALGFSLNTVSMLGLVLAIGLVVDDAIVVVENVERQLENGLAPLAAAKAAMREVTGPIIATTAVLAAVFVPVAFLPGVTGRLYNQFALTIAISVAISAFNSLTLSPALCAVMLRHREPSRFILFRAFNAGFSRMMHAYANAIRHLIGVRWLVLAVFAVGLALTYGLYTRVPTGFLPVEDQGYFFAVAQLPDGASLERTETVAEKIRSILAAEDGVRDVVSVSGLNFLTSANQSNALATFAVLKPWSERGGLTASQIVAQVQPKLLAIPAAVALSFDPPAIPGIAATGGFELQDRKSVV